MEYVLECRYHVSSCECCLRKYAKRLFSILMSLFIILPVVLSASPVSYADDGLGDVVSSAIGGAGVGAAVGGAVGGAVTGFVGGSALGPAGSVGGAAGGALVGAVASGIAAGVSEFVKEVKIPSSVKKKNS